MYTPIFILVGLFVAGIVAIVIYRIKWSRTESRKWNSPK